MPDKSSAIASLSSAIEAAAAYAATLAPVKYDPNQPRDENGMWTDGGGGGSRSRSLFLDDDSPRYGSNSPSDEHGAKWRSELSDNQKSAIHSYTGGGYESLNSELRSGAELSPINKSLSDELDAVIESSPKFDSPVVVYRGINIGDSVISQYGAELAVMDKQQREAAIRNYIDDYAVDKFKPGAVIEPRAYQSTSFRIEPALDASISRKSPGVIFEIKATKGAFLNGVSRYDDEDELLLSRKTKYRVIKVVRSAKFSTFDSDTTRTLVQVEQIDE